MEKIKLFIKKLRASLKDKEKLCHSSSFLIKITLIPLILFWLAYLTNFTLLRQILSLYLIFFLPGYLLTPVFFSKASKTETFVLSYIISIFIMPLVGYLLALKDISLNESSALLSLHFLIIFFSFIFVIARISAEKNEIETEKESYVSLLLVLGFFVILMSILLKIYPFLPEADPYNFYSIIEKLVDTGTHPQITYRPFFSILVAYLYFVGKFSVWTSMKYLLAFLPIFPLAIFWEYARKKSRENLIKIALPLIYISVPALFIEAEVVRPQIIFASIFPICLYFLYQAIRNKLFMLWLLTFVISILSVKYHELGLFLIATSAISFPFVLKMKWHDIRLSEIMMGLILLLFIQNAVLNFICSTLSVSVNFFSPFSGSFAFKPWFLNNFTNIDGINVSWIGIDIIKYYAYLIGSVMPIVLLLGFSKTTLRKLFKSECIPFMASFVLFFLIAEVLPRFNINFLPDRAWLFVSTTLVFMSIPFLEKCILQISQKKFGIGFFVLFIISLGGSFYIAYAKQGYITRDEYAAADYLKNNTPENSVIISQESNNIIIEFFGKRKIFSYRPIFYSDEKIASQDLLLARESAVIFLNENKNLADSLKTKVEDIVWSLHSEDDIGAIYSKANEIARISRHIKILNKKIAQEKDISEDMPIYILYSFDKNDSLYAQRDWWRQKNFTDANIANISNSPSLEKVFDNGSVMIWKMDFSKEK